MNQEIMDLKLLKPPRKKKTKINKKSRGGNRGADNQSRGITSEGIFSKDDNQVPLNDDLGIESNLGSDLENE